MTRRSLARLLVLAASATWGCKSGGGEASPDAGDGGVSSDARPADASPREGAAPDGAGRDARAVNDGGVDSGSPYGDRNLGVSEPYPASVLIQNGGRFYDVTKPPTSMQHAATGNGKTDDTPAIQDAFDYLKAAYVAADPTGDPTDGYDGSNYWLYFPNGTYRVTSTLSYRGPTLATSSFPCDLVRVRVVGESREGTTLKLDDDLPAFGDASTPAILPSFSATGPPSTTRRRPTSSRT